jgi:hypothetical protein
VTEEHWYCCEHESAFEGEKYREREKTRMTIDVFKCCIVKKKEGRKDSGTINTNTNSTEYNREEKGSHS